MKIAAIIPKVPHRFDHHDAAIVVLAGCSFTCPHCFVPELVLDADQIERVDIPRAFEILFTQTSVSHVVITGGEPLNQGKKLLEFLETLKNGGFKVKLETNGSEPEVLQTLLEDELVDFVTLDIKHVLREESYQTFTTQPYAALRVRQSIQLLRRNRVPFEFSFTFVPWIHRVTDVLELARMIQGPQTLVLQPFQNTQNHVSETFQECPSASNEGMQHLAKELQPYFGAVKIKTITSTMGLLPQSSEVHERF